MAFMARFGPRHFPTDYSKYRATADSGTLPADFPRMAEVNRFCHRYRAAKAYEGAKFDSYGDDTAKGYMSLLALILAFSAFEYYYKHVLGLRGIPDIGALLWAEHPAAMQHSVDHFNDTVRSTHTDELFEAIKPHIDRAGQRTAIEDMIAGKGPDLLKLLAAVRHAFVHGHLAPNINQIPPLSCRDLCAFGHLFLLDMMDRELTRLINL